MYVGVIRMELALHAAFSLKDKRSQLRSLLARCRNRFPVSAAEVGMQDVWSRASVGFAVVVAEKTLADGLQERIETEVERDGSVEIVAIDQEWLHYG